MTTGAMQRQVYAVYFALAMGMISQLAQGSNSINDNSDRQGYDATPNEKQTAGNGDRRPNIVLLLTDDQDVLLGGMDYMPHLQTLLQEEGVTFESGYVHTPICCPSRSSILTGSYLHNGVATDNGVQGNCYGEAWKQDVEPHRSFAVHAHAAGYTTSFAGKYLNNYGFQYTDGKADPKEAVPPGWDKWFGLVGNSVYYEYNVIQSDDSGKSYEVKHHEDDYENDYLPNTVAQRSLDVLEELLSDEIAKEDRQPFLLVNAWPTPHQPFTPAPWANNTRLDLTAPVTPNYNASDDMMQKKHWILRQLGPMNQTHVDMIDDMYHHRIESLLSVDDHVRQIVELLDAKGELDNTYILYTSDNGFQLGQHRLLHDKRHLYENDVRVPYILRGPGIPKNATAKEECIALNVDIAPTFFDIVHNLTHPHAPVKEIDVSDRLWKIQNDMDGQSILPCFHDYSQDDGGEIPGVRVEPKDVGSESSTPPPRRSDFLVTYFGEYQMPCELWWCDLTKLHHGFPFPIDGKNNTYNCVRTIDEVSEENSMYCRFEDQEDRFGEYYDLVQDPWQLHNTFFDLSPEQKEQYEKRLEDLKACKGKTCHSFPPSRRRDVVRDDGATKIVETMVHVDGTPQPELLAESS
jgi:N-acetylglucosamine-6-sulfatase